MPQLGKSLSEWQIFCLGRQSGVVGADRSRLAPRRERPPNRPAARRPRHRCADIRLAPAAAQPAEARLAIRPYPSEFEKTVHARDGRALTLRPIRPEDEPALQAFVLRQSPEDRRLRFFSQVKELNHQVAARLTQIDYNREMAFVLIDPHAEKPAILGIMSIFADPEGARAEYAGAVRSDLKGQASAACCWRKSSSAASAAASASRNTPSIRLSTPAAVGLVLPPRSAV